MRLGRSTVGEKDWAEFNAWLDESDAHGRVYDEVINLWSAYQALAHAPRVHANKTPRRRVWMAAAAAVVALLAMLPLSGLLDQGQVYRTAQGETRTIRLADGTRIDLNSGSTLKVRLGRQTRQVEMADAEAVFDVAKDPNRPFVISAGDEKIRVVGTRFNVRRRDGVQSVTVERGRVEVSTSAAGGPIALTPGQRLDHQEGKVGAIVRSFDPGVAMSWRTGRLVYRDEPLSHVAADLTRLAGPPVRLADSRTGDIAFSGVIAAKDSVQGAKILGKLSSVTVEETQEGILLRRN